MPGPGRPRLPSPVLKARGTYRADRHSGEVVAPSGRPECPDWLPTAAREKWDEVVPVLERMGVLTLADGEVLAAFCVAWDQFRTATNIIARGGPVLATKGGYFYPNPAVAIRAAALEQLRRFAGMFGLSPADRAKLRAGTTGETMAEKDRKREEKYFFGGRI